MLNSIKEHYYNLNVRERYMVLAMVIAIGIFIPYQFLWTPFIDGKADAKARVMKQRLQFQEMQQMAGEIKQLKGGASIATRSGKQFIFGAINNAAKKFGIASAINVKGDSEDRVRVNMENVSFDNVMKWLDELQYRQGLAIITFNVERSDAQGLVKANVVLESP